MLGPADTLGLGEGRRQTLGRILKQIAELRADVRQALRQAHIEPRAILTRDQTATYDELRGYASRSS